MVGREAEVDFAAPLRRGGAGLALTVVAVTGSPPPMDTVAAGRLSSAPSSTPGPRRFGARAVLRTLSVRYRTFGR